MARFLARGSARAAESSASHQRPDAVDLTSGNSPFAAAARSAFFDDDDAFAVGPPARRGRALPAPPSSSGNGRALPAPPSSIHNVGEGRARAKKTEGGHAAAAPTLARSHTHQTSAPPSSSSDSQPSSQSSSQPSSQGCDVSEILNHRGPAGREGSYYHVRSASSGKLRWESSAVVESDDHGARLAKAYWKRSDASSQRSVVDAPQQVPAGFRLKKRKEQELDVGKQKGGRAGEETRSRFFAPSAAISAPERGPSATSEHAVPISAHRARQAAPSRGELMVTDADNMRAGGGQQRRGIKRICVIDEDSDED